MGFPALISARMLAALPSFVLAFLPLINGICTLSIWVYVASRGIVLFPLSFAPVMQSFHDACAFSLRYAGSVTVECARNVFSFESIPL